MSRLKSYFGIKSEKHAKASSNDKETPSSEDETDDGGDSGGSTELKPCNQENTTKKTALFKVSNGKFILEGISMKTIKHNLPGPRDTYPESPSKLKVKNTKNLTYWLRNDATYKINQHVLKILKLSK